MMCLCGHEVEAHGVDAHGGCAEYGCGCGRFTLGDCAACGATIATEDNRDGGSLLGAVHRRCPPGRQLEPAAVDVLVEWARAASSLDSAKRSKRRGDRAGQTVAAQARLGKAQAAAFELARQLEAER